MSVAKFVNPELQSMQRKPKKDLSTKYTNKKQKKQQQKQLQEQRTQQYRHKHRLPCDSAVTPSGEPVNKEGISTHDSATGQVALPSTEKVLSQLKKQVRNVPRIGRERNSWKDTSRDGRSRSEQRLLIAGGNLMATTMGGSCCTSPPFTNQLLTRTRTFTLRQRLGYAVSSRGAMGSQTIDVCLLIKLSILDLLRQP